MRGKSDAKLNHAREELSSAEKTLALRFVGMFEHPPPTPTPTPPPRVTPHPTLWTQCVSK